MPFDTIAQGISTLQQQMRQSCQAEENSFYLPLLGKRFVSSEATSENLATAVNDFIAGTNPKRVCTLLGDGGSGKSTFLKQLTLKLLNEYESEKPIPFFVSLPLLKDPIHSVIEETLLKIGYDETQIAELKSNYSFIFIFDGYDEIHQLQNLYMSNRLSEWNAKTIISCRSQYLYNKDHPNLYFTPIENEREQPHLLQTFYVAPFNQDQIKQYLEFYNNSSTTVPSYDEIAAIPGLEDLITTPFLLKLVVEALPEILARYATSSSSQQDRQQLTQTDLYKSFVRRWFEWQEKKLKESGHITADMPDQKPIFWRYCQSLALEMHKYNLSWLSVEDERFVAYFEHDAETEMLRSACPIKKTADKIGFWHESLGMHFVAQTIYQESLSNINAEVQQQQISEIEDIEQERPQGTIHLRLITDDPTALRDLADEVNRDPRYKIWLFDIIEHSKTNEHYAVGAANAISILNAAGVSFSNKNFDRVKISDANLRNGVFDNTSFQEAILERINFQQSWLRGANLSGSNMQNCNFSEFVPLICNHANIKAVAYSRDGLYIIALAVNNTIHAWDINLSEKIKIYSVPKIDAYNEKLFFYSLDKFVLLKGKYLNFYNIKGEETLPTKRIELESEVDYVEFSLALNSVVIVDNIKIVILDVFSFTIKRTFSISHLDKDDLLAAQIFPDGDKLVIFSKTSLLVFDIITENLLDIFHFKDGNLSVSHTSSPIFYSIAISDNGQNIAVTSIANLDGNELGWGLFSYKHKLQFIKKISREEAHYDNYMSVNFSQDGKYIISVHDVSRKNVTLWNVEDLKCFGVLQKHTLEITTGNRDQERNRSFFNVLFMYKDNISYVLLIKGDTIFRFMFDLSLFYQEQLTQGLFTFKSHIARSSGCQIKLLNFSTGKIDSSLSFSKTIPIEKFAFSASGKLVACSGNIDDKTSSILIKNMQTKEEYSFSIKRYIVYDISFSHDDKQLAIGTNGWVYIFSLENKKLHEIDAKGESKVIGVRFIKDMLLYARGVTGSVVLWHGGRSKEIHDFTRQRDVAKWSSINCLDAYSSATRFFFVFGNNDGGVIKCFGDNNQHRYKRHSASVTSVSISFDGLWIVSGGADGLICIWEAENTHCLLTMLAHTGEIRHIRFSFDMAYLCSVDEYDELYTWKISPVLIKAAKNIKWLDFLHYDNHYKSIEISLIWRSKASFNVQFAKISGIEGLTEQQKQYLLYMHAVMNVEVNHQSEQQLRQQDLIGYNDAILLEDEALLSACEQYRYFGVGEALSLPRENPLNLKSILQAALQQNNLSTIKFLRGLGYRLLEPFIKENLDQLYFERRLCIPGNLTPFLLTCMYGCVEIAHYLSCQFDVNFIGIITANANNAIMFASENGHINMIHYLLGRYRDEFKIDQMNEQGRTALSIAAEKGHYAIVEYLVEQGASFTILDRNGISAIDYAENNQHFRIANYLNDFSQRSKEIISLTANFQAITLITVDSEKILPSGLSTSQAMFKSVNDQKKSSQQKVSRKKEDALGSGFKKGFLL